MNKMIVIAAVLFVTAANAQPFGGGTYCSMRTDDGNWAFIFNRGSMESNCAAARAGLERVTSAPITGVKHGYWNVNGYNRVLLRCGFYRNRITSVGAYALQNAYMTANGSGLSHCLFFVNNW